MIENNQIPISKQESEFSNTWVSQLAKRKYDNANENFNKKIKFTENYKLFTPSQQIDIKPEGLYFSSAKAVRSAIYITQGNTIAVKFRELMQTLRQQVFDKIPQQDHERRQQAENIADKAEESFQLYAAIVDYAMSEEIKKPKSAPCMIMENSNRYGITSIKFCSTSDAHEFVKLLAALIDTVSKKPLNEIKKIIDRNKEELQSLYNKVTTTFDLTPSTFMKLG